jgi:hypothetical protein
MGSPEQALLENGMDEWPIAPLANGADSPKHRFPLVAFADLNVKTSGAYLVKGLIPRAGLAVIWGPPKCGKSFLTLDMLLHVALGWEYRGRRVKQGTVVYCALEGQDGFGARKQAFCERHGPGSAAAPLHLMMTPLNLVVDSAELIRCIKAQLGEARPAAVAIDTLNRSLPGSESEDKDMAAYIRAADAIRAEFQCVVIIVHHCGVDASRPRGHTSLTGAADAQIAIKRDTADNVILTVEYMKDGPEGETIVSRLEPVEIGYDDDGDKITSCVIVPVEGSPTAKSPKARLTKAARIALNALCEVLAEQGVVPPPSSHIPPNIAAVTIQAWRDYAIRTGLSTSDKESARRMAFDRALQALSIAKQIAVREPHVWLTSGTHT